jgi:hypothetical protein
VQPPEYKLFIIVAVWLMGMGMIVPLSPGLTSPLLMCGCGIALWGILLGLDALDTLRPPRQPDHLSLLLLTDVSEEALVRGKSRAVLRYCLPLIAIPIASGLAVLWRLLVTPQPNLPAQPWVAATGFTLMLAAAVWIYAYAMPRYAMWVSLYIHATYARVGLVLLAILGSTLCFTGFGLMLMLVLGHIARMEMNRSLRERLSFPTDAPRS